MKMESQAGPTNIIKHNSNNNNHNHNNNAANNINNQTVNTPHHHQSQQQPQQQQQQQQPQQNNNIVATAPSFNSASNNNHSASLALQPQQQSQPPTQQQNNNVIAPAPAYTPTPLSGVGGGMPVPVPVAAHHMYNPSLSNIYVPTSGVHQHGSMYPMIPTPIPSNVYVNNVTANVNLHGWPHAMPSYIPSGAPQYVHGEVAPDQNGVMQPMSAVPVALAPNNGLVGPGNMNSSGPGNMGGRGSRRGRGRGGSGSSRRGDYNSQRHPPPEGSPVPQTSVQSGPDSMTQTMGQQHQQSQPPHGMDPQLMAGGPHTYVPHPQYAHAPYPYTLPAYIPVQNHLIHPAQAAAQQATGTPIYMPMYANAHQVYSYMGGSFVYQPEYPQYMPADDGQGDDRPNAEGMVPQIWHTQQMYSDEYGVNAEMHGVGGEEINHSTQSIGSSDTPSMLSPNYTIYGQQMHEMQQQMGMMQIYDETQMRQMQGLHPAGPVPQMEDEIAECGGQPGAIQIVPAGAIIAAAPMPIATDPQILHHGHAQHPAPPPQHILHPLIVELDNQMAPAQPQHVADVAVAENLAADNANSNNNGDIKHAQSQDTTNLQPSDSASNLNDIKQQNIENIAQEYQQPPQPQRQQQQQLQQPTQLATSHETPNSQKQNVVDHNEMYNNSKVLVTENASEPTDVHVPTNEGVTMASIATATPVVTTQQQEIQTSPPMQKYQQQQQHQQQQAKSHQSFQQPSNRYEQQTANQHHMPQSQQQQHHHYHQQQSFEQRRQQPQQAYNNTHSRRKHTPDYANVASSGVNQQQHQPHVPSNNNTNNSDSSIQTTKTMSWTNSSQHKKSTASVAVTATPTSNNTSSSSNNNNVSGHKQSSTYNHTKTFTNQQHYHQQQQNFHPHQQHQQPQQQQQQQGNYNQPQMRNQSAMKTPLSPVSSVPPPLNNSAASNANNGGSSTVSPSVAANERKNSHTEQPKVNYVNSSNNNNNNSSNIAVNNNESANSVPAATSTASTTVTPQQFPVQPQQQQHQQAQQQQQAAAILDKQYPGFTGGKRVSAAASASSTTNNIAPTINLAPPASTGNAVSSPAGISWASLFVKNNNNNNTNTTPTRTTAQSVSNNTANNNSATSNFINDSPALPLPKPVAKVAPIMTPGGMSYSAASAQGLTATPAAAPKAVKHEATTNSATGTAAVRNNANLDEYTLKFAEFLTKAKTDLSLISLRPRGLTNPSNYCYINSILQALLGCAPFYNLIRSIPKQAAALSEVKTPTVNAMISFMSNFSTLPSGLRLRTNKGPKNKDEMGSDLQCDFAFEPNEIYRLWIDSRKEYVEGRQEDAEEFLGYVLNKLNDEMLEIIKLIAKPNAEQNGQNEQSENEDGDEWQMICNNRNKGSVTRQTDFGRTPVSDIFRGELRSRLQREGEHSTDAIQPFFTLQLNIEKAASVKEALEILVGRDQLEGVTGSKSKQEVVAWQQMTLEKLPIILILHLKWFDYRSDGCTKILKKVEFPVELKIDAKILASKKYSQKQRAYRLFAVVYHEGKEATKGHYITDVYHTGYSSWLRYNDSSVKPVSENEVLYPKTPRVPYLLYYRRCDTMPQQPAANNNSTYANASNHSGRERDSK